MRDGENGVCGGVEETTGNGATCTMSWQEWTALLQAYISWMNSQLRKKAGYRRVLDLRTDLQDGVALAQLVEILGGKKVPDLDEAPCTLLARRKNVDRLILHLNNSKVNIPEASASGILEGDLRRVLQLIHAVAAHFKPSSVQKKINPNNVWNANQESNIKIQPEKPNGLFRAQQRFPVVVVNKVNNQSGKNENLARESGCGVSERSTVIRVTSNVTPPKSRAVIPRVLDSRGGETTTSSLNERVTTSSKIDGSDPAAQVLRNGTQSQKGDMNCCRILHGGKNSKENGSSVSVKTSNSIREKDWEEERKSIADDVVKARKQLLYLRDVLMRGYKGPHDRHPGRIRVDEKVKNISGSERMGIKSLKLDDNFHIADILEENERLRFENESLTKQVETKESQIAQLRDEIQLLEEKLEDYKGDAATKTNQKVRNGTSPQNEVDGTVDEQASEERGKDAVLESQDVLLPLPYRSQHQDSQLLIVKDALSSLRKCFSSTDSNQHTLDTIEQSMATLLERVSIAEAIANNSFQMDMDGTSPKEWLYMDSRHARGGPTSPASEPSIYGANSVGGHSRTYIERHTKVIYFFNKSTTPFITTVPKKIGDVTLRDFKILFDRPGQFRFHFKTLDPDYGMVKEEVLHDDDILPGWDNKIIGWVEDDV